MGALCGYPTDNGPCERQIGDGRQHCFLHNGSGPPPSHGAPVGNNNAVGNSGGGAPKGNENAYKYGAWCDPGLLYDRLWGDAKEVVDGDVEAYAERYQENEGEEPTEEMMEEFRELATMGRQRRLAMNRSFEIGVKEAGCLIVEREKEFEIDGETVTRTVYEENPAVTAQIQLSSKVRNKTGELNLFPQPK